MSARRTSTEGEGEPLWRILNLIDEKVEARGEADLDSYDLTNEIARLASEARRQGAPMAELARRVKRMDPKTRRWAKRGDGEEGVSRQALDNMLAVLEKRREPRTTRASRRRRGSESNGAGGINVEALQ